MSDEQLLHISYTCLVNPDKDNKPCNGKRRTQVKTFVSKTTILTKQTNTNDETILIEEQNMSDVKRTT